MKWSTRDAAIAMVALATLGVVATAAPAQAYYTISQQDFQVSTHVAQIGWTSTPGTREHGLRDEFTVGR